ncbi:MAG TPA: hypothetical protein DC054_04355 [Blastocatellia bacterium]|nr:hypothetical protein [Blastocatellia bacterium]
MKQITRSIYVVAPAENVTVEIEATKVGSFVTLSLDGESLKPVAGVSPLTYRFAITAGSGFDQFGIISAHFPDSAPDDAKYQVFVTGDTGGRFTGSDIKKTDSSWSRSLEFRCV